jgi:hypothetical protein
MIRIAVPGASSYVPVSPAATDAVTGSETGVRSEARDTSDACTAYPSIAALSKDGSDTAAVTSSASTQPSASASPRSAGASGPIVARIVARCISTGVSVVSIPAP